MLCKEESNLIRCLKKDVLHYIKTKFISGLVLLFIIMSFQYIMPKNIAFAQSRIGVYLDKDVVEKGQTVELTVDTENTDIYSFTLQIYFDMIKLEYVNKTENSNFSQNRVIYTWTDGSLKERNTKKTEKFIFKALQDGSANIVVTGEFYDKNGNQIILQDGSAQVMIGKLENMQNVENNNEGNEENQEQVSRNNTNLKIMRLNHEGISPDFQKGIKEYYFVADNSIDSLEVTAIPENKDALVTITGNTNLKQGLNTIKIGVQSADKTSKSFYTIHVTKTTNLALANSNLENLAVREGVLYPPFGANITQYDIEVANDIDTVEVLAIPERIGANVTIQGNRNLKIGDNTITIDVKAEDGITHKRYVIKAHRRNEQEEIKEKEEQENAVEQLEVVWENEMEKNEKSTSEEKENTMDKVNGVDVVTWCLLVIIVIGFLIGFVVKHFNQNRKVL